MNQLGEMSVTGEPDLMDQNLEEGEIIEVQTEPTVDVNTTEQSQVQSLDTSSIKPQFLDSGSIYPLSIDTSGVRPHFLDTGNIFPQFLDTSSVKRKAESPIPSPLPMDLSFSSCANVKAEQKLEDDGSLVKIKFKVNC